MTGLISARFGPVKYGAEEKPVAVSNQPSASRTLLVADT